MIAFLTYAQYAAAGLLALWGTIQALRNRPAPIAMIWWAGAVLLLLIVQLVTSIVLFGQTNADPLLFFGYVPVSYTHLTLPTTRLVCRSRWSPYH